MYYNFLDVYFEEGCVYQPEESVHCAMDQSIKNFGKK
jgi:hypothetical protein